MTMKNKINRNNMIINQDSTSSKSYDTTDEEEQKIEKQDHEEKEIIEEHEAKEENEVITPEEIEIISQIGSGSFAKVYL
jgi:hypothetical protein